ncbi:hypothetical protein U1Q18_033191 [Sarracenia purpurea var. burkii]
MASPTPARTSCGTSQNTDMGTTEPFWFWSSWDRAILRRFDSTTADKAMLEKHITWPTPIRCSGGGIRPALRLLHKGNNNRSTKTMVMETETHIKTSMEPAGILKWGPRWRSMVRA